MSWYRWAPYVPVAERRWRAKRKMEALRKKGVNIQPVEIQGRKIAKTFWGQAWCDHLESFSDYENRLPRGRTYVRNGSVCHLSISKGRVEAKVSGSEIYNLLVKIKPLSRQKWSAVKRRCAGQIGSLLELLQGKLSGGVMQVVTDRQTGLFPLPKEISFSCDCPDWAVMCKHVAAVLYGVGARLDEAPQLLFKLRGVNHEELIDADLEGALATAPARGSSKRLAAGDLSDVFGIDLDQSGDGQPAGSGQIKTEEKPKRRKRTSKKRGGNSTARQKKSSPAAPTRKATRTGKRAASKRPAAKAKKTVVSKTRAAKVKRKAAKADRPAK